MAIAKLVSHEGLLAAAVQGMSTVVVCHWVSAPLSLLQTNGGSSLHEAYCIYTPRQIGNGLRNHIEIYLRADSIYTVGSS